MSNLPREDWRELFKQLNSLKGRWRSRDGGRSWDLGGKFDAEIFKRDILSNLVDKWPSFAEGLEPPQLRERFSRQRLWPTPPDGWLERAKSGSRIRAGPRKTRLAEEDKQGVFYEADDTMSDDDLSAVSDDNLSAVSDDNLSAESDDALSAMSDEELGSVGAEQGAGQSPGDTARREGADGSGRQHWETGKLSRKERGGGEQAAQAPSAEAMRAHNPLPPKAHRPPQEPPAGRKQRGRPWFEFTCD